MGHTDYGIVAVSINESATFSALLASGGRFSLTEREGAAEEKREISAITSVFGARSDRAAIVAAIADPRTMIITLSVDAADLRLTADGKLDRADPDVVREMEGCADPITPIGQIVAGLGRRASAGFGGVTIFMCDNYPGSNLWVAGLVDAMAVERDVQLADWIAMNVRFPASYSDRLIIEQRDSPCAELANVCVESFSHWVIEDNLGHERADLEDIGVVVVPDVRPFLVVRERLLEGGLCLAGFVGIAAGHNRLDDFQRDETLKPLLDRYLAETAALLPPVKGFDVDRYAVEVRQRFANSALTMPLWRLCANGSKKMPVRIIPTLLAAMRQNMPVDAVACVVAAWLVHCTSPENKDRYAAEFWEIAERAGDDWPRYVALACDFEPVFGSIGKNPQFRDMITRSVALLPGLASLVDG
jgi:mannitol-1-phosphate/altronate dehydrogenase